MLPSSIFYSCYIDKNLPGEDFIPMHVFTYQAAGTLIVNDGTREHLFTDQAFRLSRRNHLARYTKLPPAGGEYKSYSISLDQTFLRDFSREYGFTAEHTPVDSAPVIPVTMTPMLELYAQSLPAYFDKKGDEYDSLLSLKLKEGLLLLLKSDASLKDILFDFMEPGKIDLAYFMERHFRFNVSLERFAYLTSRSLTTFKTDFAKVFNQPPGRWLLQRRLQEAHYLMHQQGKKPSDVYLEVGFEDLSHFSFAFKKAYGVAPSHLTS